jgi:hypothetical protein
MSQPVAQFSPFSRLATAIPLAAPPPGSVPLYWSLLSGADKLSYANMRTALSSSACKHRRHHSIDINQDILSTLHTFIMRGDADDWKRALVCGICWLQGAVAINTRQLRLLLSKCKSSINAMFQNIGYGTVSTTTDLGGALAAFFTPIKDSLNELRKWTIKAVRVAPPPSPTYQPGQANTEAATEA